MLPSVMSAIPNSPPAHKSSVRADRMGIRIIAHEQLTLCHRLIALPAPQATKPSKHHSQAVASGHDDAEICKHMKQVQTVQIQIH
jgi:hypothetical protein